MKTGKSCPGVSSPLTLVPANSAGISAVPMGVRGAAPVSSTRVSAVAPVTTPRSVIGGRLPVPVQSPCSASTGFTVAGAAVPALSPVPVAAAAVSRQASWAVMVSRWPPTTTACGAVPAAGASRNSGYRTVAEPLAAGGEYPRMGPFRFSGLATRPVILLASELVGLTDPVNDKPGSNCPAPGSSAGKPNSVRTSAGSGWVSAESSVNTGPA